MRKPTLFALAWTCVALAACRRPPPSTVAGDEPLIGFDLHPIDAAALATDAASRHRTLSMPAGEVAARLGAFAMDCEDEVVIEEGNATLSRELTKSHLAWDASANVHLQTGGTGRSLEMYAVGEKALIRLDKGQLRHKSRRDVDVLEMLHAATGGLEGTLSALGGVQVGNANATAIGPLATWTYALSLKEREVGQAPLARLPKQAGAVPVPMPAAWSENASHKEVEGQLVVDQATGAVMRAAVRGSMRLSLGGRTLQLKVSHRRVLHHVGSVAPVIEPAGSVAEFRRPLRPREPLVFFRSRLAAGPDGVPTDTLEPQAPEPAERPHGRAKKRS